MTADSDPIARLLGELRDEDIDSPDYRAQQARVRARIFGARAPEETTMNESNTPTLNEIAEELDSLVIEAAWKWRHRLTDRGTPRKSDFGRHGLECTPIGAITYSDSNHIWSYVIDLFGGSLSAAKPVYLQLRDRHDVRATEDQFLWWAWGFISGWDDSTPIKIGVEGTGMSPSAIENARRKRDTMMALGRAAGADLYREIFGTVDPSAA